MYVKLSSKLVYTPFLTILTIEKEYK